MKKLIAVLAVGFLAILSSSVAQAQTGEFWFNAGESILENSGLGTTQVFGGTSNDVQLTDGFRFGFRFDVNLGDHLGAEVGYAYNRTQLQYNAATSSGIAAGTQDGMAFHQVGFDGMYYLTNDQQKIRPFVVGGLHFDNFVPPGSSLYGGGSTKFGLNFGAGIKVHLTHLWAVRLDVREYFTGKPAFGFLQTNGLLWQTEATAGVGIGF